MSKRETITYDWTCDGCAAQQKTPMKFYRLRVFDDDEDADSGREVAGHLCSLCAETLRLSNALDCLRATR